MQLELNGKYEFYGMAYEINESMSDTFPVIFKVDNNVKYVVRFKNTDEIIKGRFYKINGTAIEYKDKIHILADSFVNVDDLDLTSEEKESIINKILGNNSVDYILCKNYIESKIDAIENNVIREITLDIYDRFKDQFMDYPAATKFHHAYKHGLIYHTYNVLRLGMSYCEIYSHINKGLVSAGIILHDMMKTKEINSAYNEYTVEGKLIGHISLISEEISRTAYKLGYSDKEEVTLLSHVVLSHHNEGEFGSPKPPQIIEALIVHLSDLADAKIVPTIEMLEKTKEGEFTDQINVCDKHRFYKHKLSK